ncbi:Zn(II)2Cys6 transcription factor [Stemphylium lycopersici]|uniref:Zn(II)2Cys6 transcription factor n=1 Tax=Stemphylium lycopersici TaxID=183478 RepID=A0A364MZY0_STELY|nr:Zn(II)2Cys6 transcription factor [Stemphylium lycopersici]
MAREIGSLRALRDGESLFIGSSSGVFFVNTVRRAFSQAAAAATAAANRQRSGPVNAEAHASMSSLPTPEECIYGPASNAEPVQSSATIPPEPSSVAELPSQELTNELLIAYFRTWHSLVPFLHGPTCLEELEVLYASTPAGQSVRPRSLSMAVTLQCILNIAKLDRPDLPHLGSYSIHTDEQLLLALTPLSLKCDLASIQALLAAQLYFVATMCLHAASTVGGIILRSIYRSGLHRCPVRYASLNANEREMRKRLFWSAYCLDRFVSQSLGHPLGFQDSDIDVCKPGQTELHEPVSPNGPTEEGILPTETILHLPSNHPRRRPVSEEEEPSRESRSRSAEGREGGEREEEQVLAADETGQADEENEAEEERTQDGGEAARNESGQDSGTGTRSQNQSMQAQFIRYSRLVTRMIELFHKSIHVRSSSRRDILFLKADIDAWANTLPLFVASSGTTGAESESPALDWDLFLKVAHQQLVLLVNRPALSLEPTSAEFYHAIQICVAAARSILRLLEPLRLRGHLFWPGFMSSVWMSGLIMAFACQLKFYSMPNAIR